MENKLIIIGAGGYAAVVAETALLAGFNVVGFADDKKKLKTKICQDLEVIATVDEVLNTPSLKFDNYIVAIGNCSVRNQIYQKLQKKYSPTNIIHPKATISQSIKIGKGNVILAGTVINANSTLGDNNIINSMVLIDHDTHIGSHCHISQGTIIGSNVKINDEIQTELGEAIPSFTNKVE